MVRYIGWIVIFGFLANPEKNKKNCSNAALLLIVPSKKVVAWGEP